MKKFGSKSGFTLVELIVVIAILGILAGIAVPAYSGYIKKANEAADYTQLDAIKTAAVFAYTDEHVKDESFADVAQIDVNGKTVTVTPEGGTAAAVTISAYYDIDNFAFKSDAKSATWTPANGWVLSKS
jgi:type IV pilus assembly protein PilA